MFAYGSMIPKDIPSAVHIEIEGRSGIFKWDVNNDFGVIVSPGQDVNRVQIIHRPTDPTDMKAHQKPMRLLQVIPWERVILMDLLYDGPPVVEELDEDEQKQALKEALEAAE